VTKTSPPPSPDEADAGPNTRVEASAAARRALFAFLVTFVASRAMVLLIMSGRVPNMYFFLRGTHVHHLNYGIFLLSAVSAYLLVRRPADREARIAALVYGVAMGLTFDEFGMWLHLGGSYWQRASVDAVLVVAALLGLVAYAPELKDFEKRHVWATIAIALCLVLFALVLWDAGVRLGSVYGPRLRELESASSP
jgi:predicted secreted protein